MSECSHRAVVIVKFDFADGIVAGGGSTGIGGVMNAFTAPVIGAGEAAATTISASADKFCVGGFHGCGTVVFAGDCSVGCDGTNFGSAPAGNCRDRKLDLGLTYCYSMGV